MNAQILIMFLINVNTDQEVVVPRRDTCEWDTKSDGHNRRSNIHNKQRACGFLEWTATAEAGEGCHQHMWGLLSESARLVSVLFTRLQGLFV